MKTLWALLLATLLLLLAVPLLGADADAGVRHVYPGDSIQAAVDAARPGDTVLVHAGTYREIVNVSHSGTPAAPITLAGEPGARIEPRLSAVGCGGLSPTRDRAIRLTGGADYWTIRNLDVVGGILVSGGATRDLQDAVFDRSLPGRGDYDPEAARTTLELLGTDASDGVKVLDSRITGRGIYVSMSRGGRIARNEVANIDCGTGGGIWLGRFSDEWTVRKNYVHDLQASLEHSLTEGIRLNGASMYNLVEGNTVEDAAGPGRGITSDVNAGWNVYRANTVRRTDKAFGDQTGAWGNEWLDNVAEGSRSAGFAFDTKDNGLPVPDDGVPAYTVVRGNRGDKLEIGAIQQATFAGNDFDSIHLFANVRSYWRAAGNTWEGAGDPPPNTP